MGTPCGSTGYLVHTLEFGMLARHAIAGHLKPTACCCNLTLPLGACGLGLRPLPRYSTDLKLSQSCMYELGMNVLQCSDRRAPSARRQHQTPADRDMGSAVRDQSW
jgi:hypothetical protein